MLSGEGNKGNFARAAHFFEHFFAVVLYDYNVKLPETSWLHVSFAGPSPSFSFSLCLSFSVFQICGHDI